MSNSDDPGDRRRSNRAMPINEIGHIADAPDHGPTEEEPPGTSAAGNGRRPSTLQTGSAQ